MGLDLVQWVEAVLIVYGQTNKQVWVEAALIAFGLMVGLYTMMALEVFGRDREDHE